METKKKIWLTAGWLWSSLLGLFLLLNYLSQPEFLSLPQHPQQIVITYAGRKMQLERNLQDWFLEGKKVRSGRVEEVLRKLQSCHNPHLSSKIIQPTNPRPVVITVERKTYLLGGYNSFQRSHYLDDGEKSWFCEAGLKAILAQPATSWYP